MSIASDMTGKAALVTGAASGLGRATALALGKAGANVCIVDRNPDGLAETTQLLRDLGVQALIHTADLSVAEDCPKAVAAAVEGFGRLDALCNVAGIFMLVNAPEMPLADWNRMIAVNLSAPFLLIQAAIPHLLETEGAVVNVASTAAFVGQAYSAAYCAAKAGLVHMTKALAMEYLRKPIRYNAVAPGGMLTNIMSSFVPPEGADETLFGRFFPQRGMTEVDDVAGMIAFLASPASRSFQGSCVTVDQGMTAG